MRPPRRQLMLFMVVCVGLLTAEIYVVFLDRHHTFSIQGRATYEITEFGDGRPIAHAFLMRGEGLHGVRVQFSSNQQVVARIGWRLLRQPAHYEPMRVMEEGTRELHLGARRTWATFPVPRDGSSHDRWYAIEVRLLNPPGADAPNRPRLAMIASHDNPDRGGSLWIEGVNKPGSLRLRADRVGRTLYRRFVVEAEPNLPAFLQLPAVQWTAAVALHAALMVHAYALLLDRRPRSRTGTVDG